MSDNVELGPLNFDNAWTVDEALEATEAAIDEAFAARLKLAIERMVTNGFDQRIAKQLVIGEYEAGRSELLAGVRKLIEREMRDE